MTEPVPAVTPDLPSRGWRLTLSMLRRLPQGALSRGFGALADTPIPRAMRRTVLGSFARMFGINVDEAEWPLDHYASLDQFFVRRLRAGTRSWPRDERAAGSPVDAIIGQRGTVREGTLVQAKGRTYTALALLEDEVEARRFDGGSFITLYLSPRHYHRIHAPIAGAIAKARHIPGRLLPVNAPAVAHVPNLFAVNERLVCYLDSALGRIAIVAIGAYNVGRISAAFQPGWTTNVRAARAETREYVPSLRVAAGDEIMAFHLGSTVVALFERGARIREELVPGTEIRLGQPIANA